jgi:hypothetical protein
MMIYRVDSDKGMSLVSKRKNSGKCFVLRLLSIGPENIAKV